MTYEEIQISKDSELMIQVISLIASYAVENDMSPNETIKTVAENMLGLLKIVTFENWEKKTLPSVISTSEDCVSRAEVTDELNRLGRNAFKDDTDYDNFFAFVDSLPPVTPTHGTCKDCKHNYKTSRNTFECSNGHRFYMKIPDTFYFADFEKRGSENEIN